jgi:hypothetical protein
MSKSDFRVAHGDRCAELDTITAELARTPSASHSEDSSGDVGSVVGQEKRCGSGNFVSRTAAAEPDGRAATLL